VALFTIQNEFRYEVTRKIFEGGMGIVYEAEQHGSRDFVKRVAIKIIRPNFASQKMFIENFIGEAKLVADLIHTNIVQTYHLGEINGVCLIAMELIRGVNLEQFTQQLAEKRRTLPKELAVFITSRVARGLAYAHAKTDKDGKPLGIVHRDVSFKNIMIAFEGDVKLTDFGIAKARGFLTDQEGEVVAGKPDYMSPEQADFQITDKRSDIFSVGVVLSNLLLGKNIFKGETAEESRGRIMRQPIPDFRALDPRIDDKLNDILHHCLTRDLARRYATADELMYDLEYYIYHDGYGPTNETLGKFIRELFGQNVPRGGARLRTRTAKPSCSRKPRASKRSIRRNETRRRPDRQIRAAANFLLRRSERELEKNHFAHRTRREVGRANHLHAGIVSLAVFLPERRPQAFFARRKNSRPEHRRLLQTREEAQGCHHRVAVRETRRRRLSQHRRRH
jgi:serine/threonine protein kinase